MSELRQLLALAGAFKEGDLRVGGTQDPALRIDATRALAAVTLGTIHRTTLVDDGVTAALSQSRDRSRDSELAHITVGAAAAALAGAGGAHWAHAYRDSLGSEAIAAIAKVMTDDELSTVARRLFNPLDGPGGAIGGATHFGSRIQPNSPGDNEQEILFSTLQGVACGCGDVIIGLNPAADDVDTIVELEQLLERIVTRLALPTRFCVLSDIVKQHTARQRTRVDVGFQSLAGTSRALAGMVALDVDGILDLARSFDGLYFETGQGSEVTNGAADGLDMVTLEARTYGVARHIQRGCGSRWTIVNDVAGFIGPEVFSQPDQLYRACLEDSVMARLHGLTMGLDVCATFHMGIAPATLRALTSRIAERAAPAYLMAVAGNADPMLGYLTTSFREHPRLRASCGRDIAPAMRSRLRELGALDSRGQLLADQATVERLYATYARAGGDRRTESALEEVARLRLHELRQRGFDLGLADADAEARIERLYANARSALSATVEDSVIRDAADRAVHVRTVAQSRAHYLADPPAGERLLQDDANRLRSQGRQRDRIQLVISDGLNANAVNEQIRQLLPVLRRRLHDLGLAVADTVVVVRNGRVRVGYEIGGCLDAAAVIHLIGERPGTGLNSLSAYITYGRDTADRFRWSPDLDHSATTAICGIHPRGKPPETAASEIARTTALILDTRRSGVALRPPAAGPSLP